MKTMLKGTASTSQSPKNFAPRFPWVCRIAMAFSRSGGYGGGMNPWERTTVAIVCAVGIAGCGGKSEGEPLADEAGRFRVVFPQGFAPPMRKVRSWQHDGANRRLVVWSSSGAAGTAAVGWFDVPEGTAIDLTQLCRDAAAGIGATVTVGPEPISVAGMKPAARVEFVSGSPTTPMVGTARLVRDGSRVYQMLYLAPKGTELTRSAEFFNSLGIGDVKPAKKI